MTEFNELIKQAGLDQEAIARIDRMIMQTEARRNAILREVDRRREGLARRLREATVAIQDGEFTEVYAPQQDAVG